MDNTPDMKYTLFRMRRRPNGEWELAVGACLAALIGIVVVCANGRALLSLPVSLVSIWKWLRPR
jgi:hypothetical protein